MNITLVCNEYPPRPQGGIGTFTYHLAHGLKRSGHNITVAGLWERNSESNDGGVRVVTRAASMEIGSLSDRRQFQEWLEDDVRASRTDVIEVPEYDGMLPQRVTGCPVVVRLHQSAAGIAFNRRRIPMPRLYWCERLTLAHRRHWAAVSHFVLGYTQKVFLLRPAKAEVIYNFAPPLPPAEAGLVTRLQDRFGDFVLFVGKLTAAKGAFDLARAARLFLADHPALSVVYVGRDSVGGSLPASERIRRIVGSDVARRIHFAGQQPHSDISAWMTAARIYVNPTHLEACPMTVIEAMRSGTPIICSARTACPEIIDEGITGLLVDPGNPVQVAQAVGVVQSDRGGALIRAATARHTARQRFDIESLLRTTIRFYADAMSAATA